MWVSIFSARFVLNISHSNKNWARCDQKRVLLFLSYFNETWNFWAEFRNKCSDTKLDWSVWTCLPQLYDGRDMYIIYYIKNKYMFRPWRWPMKRVETCSCSLCNKLYTYLYHHIFVLDKCIHSSLVYSQILTIFQPDNWDTWRKY